jgi:hypothetical protein
MLPMQAAADYHVTLTPHDTAISRAADAVQRLEAFMDSLRGPGRLRHSTAPISSTVCSSVATFAEYDSDNR